MNLCDPRLGSGFLAAIPKAEAEKETNKLDFVKF